MPEIQEFKKLIINAANSLADLNMGMERLPAATSARDRLSLARELFGHAETLSAQDRAADLYFHYIFRDDRYSPLNLQTTDRQELVSAIVLKIFGTEEMADSDGWVSHLRRCDKAAEAVVTLLAKWQADKERVYEKNELKIELGITRLTELVDVVEALSFIKAVRFIDPSKPSCGNGQKYKLTKSGKALAAACARMDQSKAPSK